LNDEVDSLIAVTRRDSAVLVPVFRDADGELRLVLVVRGEHGVHGGQLGLPGGRAEVGDRSPLDTALREAEEEIGLRRGEVDVVAALDLWTRGRPISGCTRMWRECRRARDGGRLRVRSVLC
jgi:8-oxo-dGTP pyrophosphatase MutT (NUDIX family)